METGSVFWAVIAYSFLAPILVRFAIQPLSQRMVSRAIGKRLLKDPESLGKTEFLVKITAIASVPTILSGPWVWGRSVSRMIEAHDEMKRIRSERDGA